MDDPHLADLVLDLWERHSQVGGPARAVLGDVMPGLGLGQGQRREVARAVYRMLRLRRRIDYALDRATGRHLTGRLRARAAYAASLVLDGRLDPAAAPDLLRLPRPSIDWQQVAGLDAAIASLPDPVERFGLQHSIPDWLAGRFLAEFADEAAAVAAGLNAEPPLTVRTNLLRTTRDDLRATLGALGLTVTETRHAPHGLVLEGDVNLFATEPFRAGWFEQQDEASQLCAHVVAPPPGGRVFDACAGSGGKTLAIAAALRNAGVVLATDVHRHKLRELVQRRRRAGTHNVRSRWVPGDEWPAAVAAFAKRADRILLDVPCDGVGTWRRRPDARWRLQPEHLDLVGRKQASLLRRAVEALPPGGRIVYATCTVFREANEDRVEAALATDPDLELVPIAEILGAAAAAPISAGRYLRTWPHRHGMDGFFAAVLRRRRLPRH